MTQPKNKHQQFILGHSSLTLLRPPSSVCDSIPRAPKKPYSCAYCDSHLHTVPRTHSPFSVHSVCKKLINRNARPWSMKALSTCIDDVTKTMHVGTHQYTSVLRTTLLGHGSKRLAWQDMKPTPYFHAFSLHDVSGLNNEMIQNPSILDYHHRHQEVAPTLAGSCHELPLISNNLWFQDHFTLRPPLLIFIPSWGIPG